MADGTAIEWADGTLFGAPLPKRCSACRQIKEASDFQRDRSRTDGRSYVCASCRYRRADPDRPGARDRRLHSARGERWCRECRVWMPAEQVTKQGLCREHQRQSDRALYASDERYRTARKAHAVRHRRGVEPVPQFAREALLEEFEGQRAYCPGPAQTWDHVIPVTKGGKTEAANILPCCKPCNSSKRNRDLWEWVDATGREVHVRALERLSHFQVI